MRGIAEADQSREPNDNEDSAERRWSRMVMRFDPFRDIDRLAQQLTGALRSQSTSIPMDAYRRGDTVFVHFDLPGADSSSIEIQVEQNALTVRAERYFEEREGTR